MKKILFVMVTFAAISFASCGNKTASLAAGTDSDTVTVDSVVDSVATDSVVK